MPRIGHLTTGLLGAGVLFAVEWRDLGSLDPAVLWPTAALFAALGLAVGWILVAVEALAARLELSSVPRAALRAGSALIIIVPLTRHLFDGSFAATLPGAGWGNVWVPAATWAVLALALGLGERLLPPRVAAILLSGLAVILHLVDRKLYPKGYGDLHLLLAVAVCVAAGLALRLAVNGRAATPRLAPRRALAVTALVLVPFGLALRYGFSENRARWVLATRWTDTFHLVRFVRSAVDRDGDGYSAVLGGGDCDDGDARVHPLAEDVPGDGVDADCDGVEASAAPAPRAAASRAVTAWRQTPDLARTLAAHAGDEVLVICVDALRADLTLDTPDNRRDFPHVLALLDESRRFRRAFAPSSSTYVSLPSMLTGRIDPFEDVHHTLPEVMRASGRETQAIFPTDVLRWVGDVTIRHGLDRLEEQTSAEPRVGHGGASSSRRTTELGLEAVDRLSGRPGYLWLHYYDVHEHAELSDDDPALASLTGWHALGTVPRYRAAFSLVDRAIGELVQGLRERGLWEHTIVVLVGDHGEGLSADPRLPDSHNMYVYNALVHVPLAFRVPGLPGADDLAPVSIADLTPTLAAISGQPVPPGLDGQSLLPQLLGGPAPEPRVLVMRDTRQYAVIAWPYKLLVRPGENLVELYDLTVDFDEREDLSDELPGEVAALQRLYHSFRTFPIDQSPEGRRRRDQMARQGFARGDGLRGTR